uniref:Uncharacterized protein n=1 Tax=Caenorhabditis tropicalis TaxID=1561998 RepID=A0A1I7TJ95_9PELO
MFLKGNIKITKRPLLPVIRWTKWKLVTKLLSLFTIAAHSDCFSPVFLVSRVGPEFSVPKFSSSKSSI